MRRVLGLGLLAWAASAFGQTTFHSNVARTGVYESAGPAQLKGVKWSFKTGAAIVASPAIADGVVYITSLDGHLFAIDQETGKEKWNFKSRMPIASSPTVSGGTVYFVSSAGALAAIDAATGKPKWVFATEFERKFEAKNLHGYPSAAQTIPDAWDIWISSPAVANGKVYFGSGDGNVYAITADTGVELWKVQTKDVVHASPAVFNNIVSGAGTAISTLSTPRPETRSGRSRQAKTTPFTTRLDFNRRPRWWTESCTSDAATATSMLSTPLTGGRNGTIPPTSRG